MQGTQPKPTTKKAEAQPDRVRPNWFRGTCSDDKIAGADFHSQHSEGAGRHQAICGTRRTEALGENVGRFRPFP